MVQLLDSKQLFLNIKSLVWQNVLLNETGFVKPYRSIGLVSFIFNCMSVYVFF